MSNRSNNFDALRLAGALLVAVGHTFDIFGGQDPLGSATGNQSLGGVGLNIFCVISGFLITQSRVNNAVGGFFRSRALRIFPALLASIPIMALIIGPIMSELPATQYFASAGTWSFLSSVAVFPLNPTLPSVFGGAPIIAQLYSLTAEVGFYLFVGLLGTWKHYGKFLFLLVAAVFSAFIHFDYSTLSFSSLISLKIGQMVLFSFPVRLGLICVFYLLAGSVIAKFCKDMVLLSKIAPYLIAVWVVALLNHDRRVYDIVEMVAFPVAVIGIGVSRKFIVRIPNVIGDLSYGIYIWHFIVAELVVTLLGRHVLSATWMIASLVASCAVAYVSYHLVEKRALTMKSTMRKAHTLNDAPVARSAS